MAIVRVLAISDRVKRIMRVVIVDNKKNRKNNKKWRSWAFFLLFFLSFFLFIVFFFLLCSFFLFPKTVLTRWTNGGVELLAILWRRQVGGMLVWTTFCKWNLWMWGDWVTCWRLLTNYLHLFNRTWREVWRIAIRSVLWCIRPNWTIPLVYRSCHWRN